MGEATAAAWRRWVRSPCSPPRPRPRGGGRRRVVARTGSRRVELAVFDLSDLDLVRAGAAALSARHPCIDVPVNNAGLPARRADRDAPGLSRRRSPRTTSARSSSRACSPTARRGPTRRGSSTWRPPPRAGEDRARFRRPPVDAGLQVPVRLRALQARQHLVHDRTGAPARGHGDHGELPAPRDRPIRVGPERRRQRALGDRHGYRQPLHDVARERGGDLVYLAWSPSVAATSGALLRKCKEVAPTQAPPTGRRPAAVGRERGDGTAMRILITGAGRAIGAATAQELSARGTTSSPPLVDVFAAREPRRGPSASPSMWTDQRSVDAALAAAGELDCRRSTNAAVLGSGPVEDFPPDRLAAVFETNQRSGRCG